MVPINRYVHTAITHAEKSTSRIKLVTKPCVKRFAAKQNIPVKILYFAIKQRKNPQLSIPKLQIMKFHFNQARALLCT